MLQINASTPPSSRASAAGADAPGQQPASTDGFEALLAGLMAAVVPPVVPMEQARPITVANADTENPDDQSEDGEAAAGDALAEDAMAGDAGRRQSDATVPGRGRADAVDDSARALPIGPGPAAAGASDETVDQARSTGQPSPRSQGEQAVTDAAVAERPRAGRPLGDAGTEPRPIGTGAANENVRSEPQRPPVEPVNRPAGERPVTLVETNQRAKAQPGTPTASRAQPDTPSLRADVAVQPAALGPLIIGSRPAFAQLVLQADWRAPADAPAAIGLTASPTLPGAAERAALASVETLAGSAQPAVRQLAAAIDRAVGGELRQLTIQLNPKALGTIEIALEFDADRKLAVVILAERPETLELLRGEARELQRLLAQQGIDLADAGLELGLMDGERRHGQPRDGEQDAAADGSGSDARSRDNAASGPEPPRLDLVGTPGRLNLTI